MLKALNTVLYQQRERDVFVCVCEDSEMTIKRLYPQRDLVGLDKKKLYGLLCFALLATYIKYYCYCARNNNRQNLVMYANQVQGYRYSVCTDVVNTIRSVHTYLMWVCELARFNSALQSICLTFREITIPLRPLADCLPGKSILVKRKWEKKSWQDAEVSEMGILYQCKSI